MKSKKLYILKFEQDEACTILYAKNDLVEIFVDTHQIEKIIR
jgi:hypothetical protein